MFLLVSLPTLSLFFWYFAKGKTKKEHKVKNKITHEKNKTRKDILSGNKIFVLKELIY